MMKGFVQEADRQQTTLLPECLDDWVGESNPVRAVDVFVDALELCDLGFDGVDPAATGRPAYHPSPMLKLYIYGYLKPSPIESAAGKFGADTEWEGRESFADAVTTLLDLRTKPVGRFVGRFSPSELREVADFLLAIASDAATR